MSDSNPYAYDYENSLSVQAETPVADNQPEQVPYPYATPSNYESFDYDRVDLTAYDLKSRLVVVY
jgi:hypothetical protein